MRAVAAWAWARLSRWVVPASTPLARASGPASDATALPAAAVRRWGVAALAPPLAAAELPPSPEAGAPELAFSLTAPLEGRARTAAAVRPSARRVPDDISPTPAWPPPVAGVVDARVPAASSILAGPGPVWPVTLDWAPPASADQVPATTGDAEELTPALGASARALRAAAGVAWAETSSNSSLMAPPPASRACGAATICRLVGLGVGRGFGLGASLTGGGSGTHSSRTCTGGVGGVGVGTHMGRPNAAR